MAMHNREVLWWELHKRRLQLQAQYCQLQMHTVAYFDIGKISYVLSTLQQNIDMSDCAIKILVSEEDVIFLPRNMPQYTPAGISYAVCVRNQTPQMPYSVKFSERSMWDMEKAKHGVSILLFVDENNHYLEFSDGSVFVYRAGIFYTPPLSMEILPSITRHVLLELSKNKIFPFVIREKVIEREEGDILFFASALRGLVPVDPQYIDLAHFAAIELWTMAKAHGYVDDYHMQRTFAQQIEMVLDVGEDTGCVESRA